MKVSVVIPSYNGCDRLDVLCNKIIVSLTTIQEIKNIEILVVDDGSKIKPDKIILNFKKKGIDVKGIFLKRNYGQQLATLAGLKIAKGDFVFTIDDDLSHNPDDFEQILALAERDNLDAVFGIPKKNRTGVIRKSGSVIRDIMFSVFFRKPDGVSVSSFRLLSRSLINRILEDISEYRYLSVEIIKCTRRIDSIQVNYTRVSENTSRYNFFKLVSLFFSLIRCSKIFPVQLRRTNIAASMEYEII